MISADFVNELKKLIEGDKQVASRPLVVGKPSDILSKCGANIDQDITITKKVIDKGETGRLDIGYYECRGSERQEYCGCYRI